MSSGADKQKMKGRDIPTRRVVLNDISQLPSEYSTTPGGTFFSTTPGGMSLNLFKCTAFFNNSCFRLHHQKGDLNSFCCRFCY